MERKQAGMECGQAGMERKHAGTTNTMVDIPSGCVMRLSTDGDDSESRLSSAGGCCSLRLPDRPGEEEESFSSCLFDEDTS